MLCVCVFKCLIIVLVFSCLLMKMNCEERGASSMDRESETDPPLTEWGYGIMIPDVQGRIALCSPYESALSSGAGNGPVKGLPCRLTKYTPGMKYASNLLFHFDRGLDSVESDVEVHTTTTTTVPVFVSNELDAV